MKKKNLKFLIPIIVTMTLLLIVKITEPEEIDWNYSFAKKDKIPYGGFIVSDILPELFPGTEILTRELPIYNILKDKYYTHTNYVFINSYFSPDKLDTEYLLNYVKAGNDVFISAFGIYSSIADTLKFKTYDIFFSEDTVSINFSNPEIANKEGYVFRKGNFGNYFSEYDTASTQVLGKNQFGQANFIRIQHGTGNFFINTVPLAFTNYHILKKKNSEYVFKALSHLPVQKTFWDEYYKDGNKFSATPLTFILSQESLKWAYYLILASVIIFIIFYGRRKQRIIPVIFPLTNTTIEFVETVGNLYYQQKDYKNIAEKKILYFEDFIRNKYFLKTSVTNEVMSKKISEKTLLPEKDLQNLFMQIEIVRTSANISEEQLTKLNSQLEEFYKSTK